MKRTPLRRKTPLRAKERPTRSHRMLEAIATFATDGKERVIVGKHQIRVRSKTKHARRERAPASWWLFVKSQPCFVAWLVKVGAWEGPITPCSCEPARDADHMGNRFSEGDGTRARDATCVSICHTHHMERHALTGAFKLFDGERMQAFCATGVQWMHNRARAAGIVIPDC